MPDGADLQSLASSIAHPISSPVASEDNPLVNLPVEQALLGALLLDSGLLEALPPNFRADHYADTRHAEIHRGIEAIAEGSKAAPLQLVGGLISADPALRRYISQLPAAATGYDPDTAASHAKVVTENYRARQIEALGRRLMADARRMPIHALAARSMSDLDMLISDTSETCHTKTLGEAVAEARSQVEEACRNGGPTGISTGIPSLDRAIGNMQKQQLILIAARSGMGKSTLATTIMVNRAKEAARELAANGEGGAEYQGGVFGASLEMSNAQLGKRVLASEGKLGFTAMQRGELNNDEFERMLVAEKALAPLPLVLDDEPGQTVAMIAVKARAAARKFGKLSLVVIDHATIVKPDDRDTKANNPAFMFARISNALKRLAKALDCPVIVLVQLNRDVEKRQDNRPKMSDLAWSSSFEQDADVILLMYREHYYLRQAGPPKKGQGVDAMYQSDLDDYKERLAACERHLELIIAKCRDGEPGSIELDFDGAHSTIGELAA